MAVITIPVLRPQVGTIRPGTFKYVPTGKKAEFELVQEHIDFDPTKIRTKLVEYKANEFDPELDIASCDTIVCVGNGVRRRNCFFFRASCRNQNYHLAQRRTDPAGQVY